MEQKRFANLILENRKKLCLSAVIDVINFDDETIILNTDIGRLTIKGTNLHIINFDNTVGDLTAEGEIAAMVYTDSKNNENFFKKVFK